MAVSRKDDFSADKQALGYLYQSRFALLKILESPESVSLLVEKDDDLDFTETDGLKSLASLKHKAPGEKMTDLSTDFWKSVRIWITRYIRDTNSDDNLRFFLFTTNEVAPDSFLSSFLPDVKNDYSQVLSTFIFAMKRSTAKVVKIVEIEFMKMDAETQIDFLSKINIFDNNPRIEDIPEIITNRYFKTVRRENRKYVFEHLEGWWSEIIIQLLTKKRTIELYGYEVSDKISSIAEEYKMDNLPINFRGKKPAETIDIETDNRLFVLQLKEIGISPSRIEKAIYDYYRAFEQRSSWARENVLFAGEIEDYEERLIDEWERYRDIIFDKIDNGSEDFLRDLGQKLYQWAEMNTTHLRIREKVSEPYVVRGNYHILANHKPEPKVYWHPMFLNRINSILTGERI